MEAAPGAPSLRVRLARALLIPLLIVLPLATYLQYVLVLQPAVTAFDHELGDIALALGNLIRPDADGRPRLDINPQTERALRNDQRDRTFYAVLAPDHTLLAGDASLRGLAQPLPSSGQPAFGDGVLEGLDVRRAVLTVPCGPAACEVLVAETLNKRRAARRDALLAVLVPMLLLAAALLVLTLAGIRRGLRPLEALRAELAQRSLERLEPVGQQAAVAELRPLIGAVNHLFARLRHAAELQKSFIAAAAHQLRTPLTTLRTEAELALLEPHPPALTPTLTRLSSASERAARLASQLLTLARAESPSTEPRTWADLQQIARAEGEEWALLASRRGADIGFELAPAPVLGRPMLLRELLANLLHNALEYAGEAARITVRTGQDAQGRAVLEVEDDGPGIAPEHRDAVLQRFQRGPGAPGRGSGLGLAIVRDIVREHGGELLLQDADPAPETGRRGLRVRASFAAPADAAP